MKLSFHNSVLPKVRVLSIEISTGPYLSFVSRIIEMMKLGQSDYICVANVHMLIEAKYDQNFAKIVNTSSICTPDGVPIAVALKLLQGISQERVAGMDLLPDILREAELQVLPVFFYGGTDEMLKAADKFLQVRYPNLTVAGMHSPPFRELTNEEEIDVITMINSSGAKIVFVALGCPKQEKWMSKMLGKVMMPMIGIGGALPVMIGLQKRAPKWIQNSGLEWLYRLMQEPKRLFRRYAVTNSVFLWMLLRALVVNKFLGRVK